MPDVPIGIETRQPQGVSRRRVFAVLGLAVLILAIPLVATKAHTSEGVSRNPYITELILPMLFLLLAAAAVIIFRRVFREETLDIVWCRWSRSELVGTALLIVAVPIVYVLANLLVHDLGLATRHDRLFYADGLGLPFFLGVTILGVLAIPFVEEVFWRGCVQAMLTHAVGPLGAWIAQAALFAGMHLRPLGGFLSLLVFGLMAGLWRWRRRTLLPVILAHVAVNGVLYAGRWPGWLEIRQIRTTHDYNADLIAFSRPRSYDPNDDARYDYERAFELCEAIPGNLDGTVKRRCAEWTTEQRQAIRQWVGVTAEAIEHLEWGARKPYYCPDYHLDNPHSLSSREAAAVRNLTLALHARIGLRAWDSQEEEMVRDIMTLWQFGTHVGGRKPLMYQLTGAAIRERAVVTARTVLASHSFSRSTLARL